MELLETFEKEFEKTKKQLKFKAQLDQLDEIFFMRDYIAKEGFVSRNLSRQVCRRIADFYGSWAQVLYDFTVPNPNSYLSVAETNTFSEDEKRTINTLISKIMIILRTHSLLNVHDDASESSKFIDTGLALWKKDFEPILTTLLKKVIAEWEQRSKEKPVKEKKEKDSMYG